MSHVVIVYKKLSWHKPQLEESLHEEPSESVCRTMQQSQGSIGSSKRHPVFCCVYKWVSGRPPTFGSQLVIGWIGSVGVEELRAPRSLRAGQLARTGCAHRARFNCVSGARWDVEDLTRGPHHRKQLKTWVVSHYFTGKGELFTFLLTFPFVFEALGNHWQTSLNEGRSPISNHVLAMPTRIAIFFSAWRKF